VRCQDPSALFSPTIPLLYDVTRGSPDDEFQEYSKIHNIVLIPGTGLDTAFCTCCIRCEIDLTTAVSKYSLLYRLRAIVAHAVNGKNKQLASWT